jgi:hypothetical protein
MCHAASDYLAGMAVNMSKISCKSLRDTSFYINPHSEQLNGKYSNLQLPVTSQSQMMKIF